MHNTGYYEIIRHTAGDSGLKVRIIPGNVQFNRLHWHDSLEIMCCIHGSFHMHINGTEYVLKEGDLITVGSGQIHEISNGTPDGLQLIFSADSSLLRLAPGEEYAFSTVGDYALSKDHADIQAVRTSLARLVCLLFTPKPPVAVSPEITSSALKETLLRSGLPGQLVSDEDWYRFHMELYHILLCLSRHKQKAAPYSHPGKSYHRLIQCVELLHQSYGSDISAASLAAEIGFSEPTVYRLFRRHMGVSFKEYLNSVRISAACTLITESDLNITEIAAKCGYTSLSNFYRAFHQLTGMSPREYRHSRRQPKQEQAKLSYTPDMQYELLRLNCFQPFSELPYSYEDLMALAEEAPK